MAKIIYVCLRDPSHAVATARAIATVAERLLPDNLPRMAPRILAADGIITGIAGHSEQLRVRGTSLAAGYLVEPGSWERPRSGRPDGAFALFRSDDSAVEIVSDTLASRTVWYVLTDRMFVASTSQRAIVALLGRFEFNPDTVPWMLAAGTLGPGQSWDKRIRCLSGATCVHLDRKAWTLKENTEPVRFVPRAVSDSEHERLMVEALHSAVGPAKVADPSWAIALSGGVDCRTILCLLKETQGLRAVTWGLRASLNDPMNDACIARQLAEHFGLEHQYFETDQSTEPVDRAFERFVANGEGRIDHVSGYADGFNLWRNLHDIGVRGIVRGDEAFGMTLVHTPRDVRSRYLPLWSDFAALPALESFGLPPQSVPEWLQQQPGESLETWRDRIQQQYRTPYNYAALSDLKLPYVEIINPLISGSIVDLVRQLPDGLRTDKALFQRIARSLTPNIPFATRVAIHEADDFLKSRPVVELLRDSLSGDNAGSAVPRELAAYARGGLAETAAGSSSVLSAQLRRAIKPWVPAWAKRFRSTGAAAPSLHHNRLAFRAYLVSQVSRMFHEDAASLSGVFPNPLL